MLRAQLKLQSGVSEVVRLKTQGQNREAFIICSGIVLIQINFLWCCLQTSQALRFIRSLSFPEGSCGLLRGRFRGI